MLLLIGGKRGLKKPLLKVLRCPKCQRSLFISENNANLNEIHETTLACEKGHIWKVEDGIPSLVFPSVSSKDAKWIAQYEEMAESYDDLVKQYDDWLGIDMMKERERIVRFVPIEAPVKILDVSIGTAATFIALYNAFQGKQMERFNLHGLDLSLGMLKVAKQKIEKRSLDISLVHGNVFNIPYKNNSFNIVYHSGGINTFSDIGLALNEMLRVVRSGGIVVVVDEGLSPDMRESEKGKEIIRTNSLFAARPPIAYLPEKVKDVEMNYIMNGTFYEVVFRK
ncbi:MAG: methyltransferase domain-containing protein [Candidatus Thorarchaeota archaeon]|nr:methyltransferase domain-containing protein [Candidatus Thorarchaeota archaeon]